MSHNKTTVISVDFSSISDEDFVGYLKINIAVLQMKVAKLNYFVEMTPEKRKEFRQNGRLIELFESIMEEGHLGLKGSRD